ncbi:MAG: hypothetical protein AB1721_00660 [Patescibacteria group bacterium]
MLDTTHVLTGLVIGKYLKNPILAFGAGVLSHFVLDAIPHWDGTKTLNASLFRSEAKVGEKTFSKSFLRSEASEETKRAGVALLRAEQGGTKTLNASLFRSEAEVEGKTLNASLFRAERDGEGGLNDAECRIRFTREGKIILGLDILISLIIFLFLSIKGPLWPDFPNPNSLFIILHSNLSWVAGVFGALLPDILLLAYIFYPSAKLKKLSVFEFHKNIQRKIPMIPGLVFQLIWISFCLYFFVLS